MKKVHSICPFCGTGCSLFLHVDNGKIIKVEGNKESQANRGQLCVKGMYCYQFVQHKDRLKKPLIKKNGKFVEVEWNEAISFVADNFKRILKKHGSKSIGVFNSSKCTNEENYLMYEFATKVLKTQNVDQCARLCHMPSGIAYSKMFGIGAMSCSYKDLLKAKTIMICGANPAEQHPIIFNWIMEAKRNGTKVIVIDPRKTKTAKQADIHVGIEEGKDDAFYIALCKYLIKNRMIDKNMIKRTEDYDFFVEELRPLGDVDALCDYAGVDVKYVKEICDLIQDKTVFINGLGLTESAGCVTNVELVGCLALLTGNIGKEGAGVAPLRGQSNVQGTSDIQVMYFRKLKNDAKTKACYFEKKFDGSLSSTEMIEGILTDQIKCLYIMGENPAMSHPNLRNNFKAFEKVDFMVVQDIFLTETAEFADVVLPGACFAEKDGTFTNAERRVQLLEKAVSYAGKPDWEIICALGKAMGDKNNFNYKNTKEIWKQIRKNISLYSGITYEAMKNNYGVQFPCFSMKCGNDKVCNESRMYENYFYRKSKKALFPAVRIYPPSIKANDKFPYRMITGGVLQQFQTGTMSRHCDKLNKLANEPFIGIHAEDAKELNVKDGDLLELSAPNGESIRAKARISDEVKRKYVFVPVNFKEARVNMLTSEKLIDVSKTPEYKGAIINVKKIN